ncbi:MAG TPA: AI-2E family transporter [Methanospirillum sp.]|nr:AI-2E family transporter [Methanospirillum sp.]
MPIPYHMPQVDRFLFLAACCFIILTGLKMAGGFFGPLILSIIAAIIFSYVSLWLQDKGLSTRVSGYVAFGIFISCLILAGAMIFISISPLISHLPEISGGIESNAVLLQGSLSHMGIDIKTIIPIAQMSGSLASISPDAVQSVISQTSALFIFLFTTFFLLLESTAFSRKITVVLGSHKKELADRINEFGSIVIDYVIIRTKVNLATGIGFGLALFLCGVPDPLVWGILMFILNFVPYIGFIIALIPPIILALTEMDPVVVLLVLVISCLINLFSENILFPGLAGRGMDLSPTVVFISMIFWGYFLGGSGVLVAIPLTVLLKMVLESYPETRWAAMIICSDKSDET